jgi:hypothetical protein
MRVSVEMETVELLLSCSSSLLCSCLVVLVGLFVFKKDVCKKFPNFPLLCKKLPGSAGGSGPSVGTRVANGTKGRANVSTFGGAGDDNGEGFVGVDLDNWKVGNLKFLGQPVIPIAVHMDHGSAYIYKVLEVKAEGLPTFYGFVVDLCNRTDSSCQNKDRGGIGFLIDIHKSGWSRLGLSESQGKNYLKTGTYTVVGEIKWSEIPKHMWTKKVQNRSSSMVCSCPKSTCDWKTATWKELGKC